MGDPYNALKKFVEHGKLNKNNIALGYGKSFKSCQKTAKSRDKIFKKTLALV
jgi:hypothetical protein